MRQQGEQAVGLHLNYDGVGYKIRVKKEAEENLWMRLHEKAPPADKQYVIDRIPATIPGEA
eukprot:7425057-Karenia_brevis.AAC.1